MAGGGGAKAGRGVAKIGLGAVGGTLTCGNTGEAKNLGPYIVEAFAGCAVVGATPKRRGSGVKLGAGVNREVAGFAAGFLKRSVFLYGLMRFLNPCENKNAAMFLCCCDS